MPSPAGPGRLGEQPVTPALLRWRVLRDGAAEPAPWTVAADFRARMIDATLYPSIYAPATTQNHQSTPGLYLLLPRPTSWKLGRRSRTGSRSQAFDTRDNRADAWLDFSVETGAVRSELPATASFRQDSQPFSLTATTAAAHATSPPPLDRPRCPGSPGRGCRVPVAGQAVRPAASGPRLLRRPAHGVRRGRERERDRGARQLHLPPGRRHRGAGRNGGLRGRQRPHPLRRARRRSTSSPPAARWSSSTSTSSASSARGST